MTKKELLTHLIAVCMLTLTALTATADDKLTEHFETGLPTSAPATETTATLASGNWRVKGVAGKKDNNSLRAAMSTDGYLVTPPLCQPGRITFSHRASGNGKQLVAEKSTDNGATWTTLGTATVSSSTPYGTSSFKCDSREEDTQVLIRLTCKSNTIYVDDVTITLNAASTAPVTEPDDPTYVTEGTWVPTKPFPTALNTIYIAPDGDDLTGDGTINRPWAGLQRAVDAAKPGTHIVCRGGTYVQKPQADGKFTVRIKSSGTAEAPIVIRCYDGEQPVFDFRDGLTAERVGERGILLTGNHWWLFGLHITHAADNGIKLEGSYNRIERCQFSYNLDTGIQLGFGHKFSDSGFGSSNDVSGNNASVIGLDNSVNIHSTGSGSDTYVIVGGRGNSVDTASAVVFGASATPTTPGTSTRPTTTWCWPSAGHGSRARTATCSWAAWPSTTATTICSSRAARRPTRGSTTTSA